MGSEYNGLLSAEPLPDLPLEETMYPWQPSLHCCLFHRPPFSFLHNMSSQEYSQNNQSTMSQGQAKDAGHAQPNTGTISQQAFNGPHDHWDGPISLHSRPLRMDSTGGCLLSAQGRPVWTPAFPSLLSRGHPVWLLTHADSQRQLINLIQGKVKTIMITHEINKSSHTQLLE